MFIDLQTTFDGSTTGAGVKTGTAVTATAISANVIDLRQAATPAVADEGVNPAQTILFVQSDGSADFAAAGAATLTITLESDSTANLATAPVVHFSTAAIGKAAILKNTVLVRVALPSADYKRFLGLRYTVATGPFTAGGILGWISPDMQRNIVYPAAFTIDV
jgi:hypothetical protein